MKLSKELRDKIVLPIDSEKNKVFPLLRKISMLRRMQSVNEAISFKSGKDVSDKEYTLLYEFKDFKLMMGKPGKEAAKDYKGKLGDNINDMTPSLFMNGEKFKNNFSFDDIFELLYQISKKSEYALELIGCLIFRCAYMLDHKERTDGVWRLEFDKEIISEIEKEVKDIQEMPIPVLLYVLEIISLNEDVKYYTLGMNDEMKEGTGRRNNLLTYCHLISVLLERSSFAKFAGSFARLPVGISALTQKNTFITFPYLKPESI